MKNLVLILVVSAVVSLVVFNLVRPEPTIIPTPEPHVGATSTLDPVNSPFIDLSGRQEYWADLPLGATSSAICAVKNPFSATTSIAMVGLNIASTSPAGLGSVAENVYVSTTTTPFVTNGTGSSTPALAMFRIAANSKDSVNYYPPTASTTGNKDMLAGVKTPSLSGSGTNSETRNLWILAPEQYLVWTIATSTPGSYLTYWRGSCPVKLERVAR